MAAQTDFQSVTLRGALAERPEALAGPALAIVGARAATRQAMEFAHALAEAVARQGYIVVSGGALGVDGAAHEGALAADGRSVVVLGTGVDVLYPERHAKMFHRVLVRGALLSPFEDRAQPRPSRFPKRNPLIAALADATVVVEASLRSGSLGTAAAARALGLPLWARPGSPGCDALILRGEARAATSIDDVLDALLHRKSVTPRTSPPLDSTHVDSIGWSEATVSGDAALPHRSGSTRREVEIEDALRIGPARAEELSLRTAASLDETLASLCELEAFGRVLRMEDGRYLALAGSADTKE